ncbi:MAG: LLM class flavin-dependent oxidoreductase [Chloroflexota bacterium]|nr:LLM class flavin-dependent oxidoreductase [Dehalococcoidia bacterium]MDW8254711.1 LLM class flavin-dependent oxidoreductase [Chloroflexota bacterium]
MEIGIFQLLSQPEGVSDREVIEQALWEVDFAEANGFHTVWVTEHHLSEYGMIGSPSVYAAAVAQRTRRLRIGYGVAVVPLHHPIRLAEEIAWVDQLSEGRLWVGVGPGFSPYEFEAFGVPLEERNARLEEGVAILQGLLANEAFSFQGRFWHFPEVRLKPRPYTTPHPPFMLASSGEESLRRAARLGLPALIGFRPNEELAARIATYRQIRAELGVPEERLREEVRQLGVLRRVHVADSDEEAMADIVPPLLWYTVTGLRIHRPNAPVAIDPKTGSRLGIYVPPQTGSLPDGSAAPALPTPEEVIRHSEGGMIAGTPETVLRQLRELQALGVGHVIAWMNFGNLPYAKVRRSMELFAREVLPALAASEAAAR